MKSWSYIDQLQVAKKQIIQTKGLINSLGAHDHCSLDFTKISAKSTDWLD